MIFLSHPAAKISFWAHANANGEDVCWNNLPDGYFGSSTIKNRMTEPSSWPEINPVPRKFEASDTTVYSAAYKFWDRFVLQFSARTLPSSKPRIFNSLINEIVASDNYNVSHQPTIIGPTDNHTIALTAVGCGNLLQIVFFSFQLVPNL